MSGRAFLHIGLPKTGTSYIQAVLWANRGELAKAGVHLAGVGRIAQRRAAWDLIGRRVQGGNETAVPGAWQSLVDDIDASSCESVLVSEEFFVHARPQHVRRVASAVSPRAPHVIVTVRDLSRAIVSMWQQNAAKGRTIGFTDFVGAVRDPETGPATSGVAFWLRYDLQRTLATWATAVRPEHIHVVVVPPAASPPSMLIERFAQAVGVDPSGMKDVDRYVHRGMSAVDAEVLRRLNETLRDQLTERQYRRAIRQVLVPAMNESARGQPIRFPAEHEGWARDRAEELISSLGDGSFDIVGELADLRPDFDGAHGQNPDDLSDAEIADACLSMLSASTQSRVRTPAESRSRKSDARNRTSARSRMWSRVRSLDHGARVKALELADRSKFMSKLASIYMSRSRRSK